MYSLELEKNDEIEIHSSRHIENDGSGWCSSSYNVLSVYQYKSLHNHHYPLLTGVRLG